MTKYNILVFLISLILSLGLGPIVIPRLRKLKIGQSIRLDGPQSHLVKAGTPTMGGIIFIISSIITSLVFGIKNYETFLCVLFMFLFGLIGFIDDYLIVVKKTNEGLSAKQKFGLQVIVSILLILLANRYFDNSLYIPFNGENTVNLGFLYYPLTLFVILGTVNSVNLTDGLDGLASSVSTIGLIAFGIITSILKKEELSVFSFIMAGSILGFLKYNWNPAKVFMGDTGSLAIGGAFSAIAVLSDLTFYLPFIGIIFVWETLSVIIQVISFKKTGKRVFLMSPYHHHLEAKGFGEVQICAIFSTITIALTILSIWGITR